ncbi:MAG TPA: tetratricopeptide repeat protein, partial [Vicingus sp.]|nr:tetratricopeptide repeat protein [Vicingus sp.]
MSRVISVLKSSYFYVLFCVLFTTPIFGQLNKGNDAFKGERYFEAIEYYEKVLKKEPNNIQA